jgi:hypothetical protein
MLWLREARVGQKRPRVSHAMRSASKILSRGRKRWREPVERGKAAQVIRKFVGRVTHRRDVAERD